MKYSEVQKLLDTYSLEEILDMNDLTEVDVLYFLIKDGLVELPEPLPLDIDI